MSQKPSILITRPIFPETIERLKRHFDVETNDDDIEWNDVELVDRMQGKDGALVATSVRIDAQLLDACPTLRICANMAVGYNNLDIDAMTVRGILATNTPDVLTETTADFGFMLLMAAARRVTESEHFLRRGEWKRWRYDMLSGSEVHGSTLGILGMGRIGQAIAKRGAHGFGMNVIYNNRGRLSAEAETECKARFVSKEELLRTCDHLVLVLPYSPETHHAIGAHELALMRPTATLVNIARGGIVDEVALVDALQGGRLAAAGLDVFEGEPSVYSGLLECNNLVLTPHIASATVTTRRRMADLAADNLIGFFSGAGALTPVNAVN